MLTKRERCEIIEEGIQDRLNGQCDCPYQDSKIDHESRNEKMILWKKGWNSTHSLICSVM